MATYSKKLYPTPQNTLLHFRKSIRIGSISQIGIYFIKGELLIALSFHFHVLSCKPIQGMPKSTEGCPNLREIGYGGCVFLRGVQIFVTLVSIVGKLDQFQIVTVQVVGELRSVSYNSQFCRLTYHGQYS